MIAEEVIAKLKTLIRPTEKEDEEDIYYNDGVIDAINIVRQLSHRPS